MDVWLETGTVPLTPRTAHAPKREGRAGGRDCEGVKVGRREVERRGGGRQVVVINFREL